MSIKNHHYLAWLWLLVTLFLLFHVSYLWMHKQITPNTDILALLPNDKRDPVMQEAFDHMVNTSQQRLIVLIGANDWTQAVNAANAYNNVIKTRPDLLKLDITHLENKTNDFLNVFIPGRLNLLTTTQQNLLQTQPAEYWVNSALSRLYSPFAGIKLTAWQDDPFGLFSDWWQAHAAETPVRPRDGKLYVADADRIYVVLIMSLQQSAFSMTAQESVMPLLKSAAKAAQTTVPNVELIAGGVVLHAAAASSQASHEMTTIGLGSLLGILLLMCLAFNSMRPILLIATSLAIGCLGALSISIFIFGQIHLLTLVFGASLIGIAQDYAIYFLCGRISDSSNNSLMLLKRLWPGLCLTLAAALLGYLGLALTPFPGLRQMAVFSSVGLIFAWLTVICWFPVLVKPQKFKASTLARIYNCSLERFPAFKLNKLRLIIIIVFAMVLIIGLIRSTTNDDIRSLQKPAAELLKDQLKINKLLDVPSPVQFYLIQGDTVETLLQREEALRAKLIPLINKRIITGYQAVSNWVPSLAMQKNNQDLIAQKLLADDGPLQQLAQKIDEDTAWKMNIINHNKTAIKLLTPDVFFASPNSDPWRYLWLGNLNTVHGKNEYASIMTVRGLNNYAHLPQLQQIATQVAGVQWVDKVASISSILGHYRNYMTWVLFIAYAVVYLLLFFRYKFLAWRVLALPALASVFTLALMGFLNIPLQLFHILALLLILGLGVDYGIFLREKTDNRENYAWLAVGLSAVSALLSFGLLALSQTPPLHAFGLTMLVGMGLVWLFALIFNQ